MITAASPQGQMARFEARVTAGLKVLLGLGLIAMVALNVANAAGRYSGLPTLTGADEALVYGMIWIVMVGAILAARTREHLCIDLLPAALSRSVARVLRLVTDAAMVVICGFIAWHSLDFIQRIGAIGQTSMGLGIPMTWAHSAIFVGFVGMSVVTMLLLLADLAVLLSGREG